MRLLWVLIAAFDVGHCSPPPSPAQACERLQRDFFALDNSLAEGHLTAASTAQAAVTTIWCRQLLTPMVEQKVVAFDPDRVHAAEAALESYNGNGIPLAAQAALGALFASSKKPGDACTLGGNVTLPPLFTDVECGIGQAHCVAGDAVCGGSCVAYRQSGDSCAGFADCLPGFDCIGGRCAPMSAATGAGEGQPCGVETVCDDGLFCDMTNDTCTKMGSGHCEFDDGCRAGDSCTTTGCKPFAQLGEACANDAGGDAPECDALQTLWCTDGRCAKPSPVGGSCAGNALCDGLVGYCDQAVCRALGAVGSACSASVPCAVEAYCDADTATCKPLGYACMKIAAD